MLIKTIQKYLTIDDLDIRDYYYQPDGPEEIVYNKVEKHWEYHVDKQLVATMNHRASCPFDANEPLITTTGVELTYKTDRSSCISIWAEWNEWGLCAPDCRSGKRIRTRQCIDAKVCGDKDGWEEQWCDFTMCDDNGVPTAATTTLKASTTSTSTTTTTSSYGYTSGTSTTEITTPETKPITTVKPIETDKPITEVPVTDSTTSVKVTATTTTPVTDSDMDLRSMLFRDFIFTPNSFSLLIAD